MIVNKEGQDWVLIRARLKENISTAREDMLSLLPEAEYHRLRGMIIAYRALIDWVEPNTPDVSIEDDYGISDL